MTYRPFSLLQLDGVTRFGDLEVTANILFTHFVCLSLLPSPPQFTLFVSRFFEFFNFCLLVPSPLPYYSLCLFTGSLNIYFFIFIFFVYLCHPPQFTPFCFHVLHPSALNCLLSQIYIVA